MAQSIAQSLGTLNRAFLNQAALCGMVQFLSFLGDSANAAGTTPFCQVMPAFFLM